MTRLLDLYYSPVGPRVSVISFFFISVIQIGSFLFFCFQSSLNVLYILLLSLSIEFLVTVLFSSKISILFFCMGCVITPDSPLDLL